MEKNEIQQKVAEMIDQLMESYRDGIYGNPMKPTIDEQSMIRISHELITLYRIQNFIDF